MPRTRPANTPFTPSPAPILPLPPPGFWRFSWFGISALLPNSWNLSFYHGTAHRGALILSDLHSPQLEIRWKSPRSLAGLALQNSTRLFDRLISRITRKSTAKVTPYSQNAVRIDDSTRTTLLAADARRCYELTWPTSPAPCALVDQIAQDFLATTPPQATAADWFWNIYGATGLIPATAKLREARMLPGECRLTFLTKHSTGRCLIILAAHSMADRLLHGLTLRAWAEQSIPQIRQNTGGTWHENPSSAAYETHSPSRRFLHSRNRFHRVDLLHDPVGNRIQWTYRSSPATLPPEKELPWQPIPTASSAKSPPARSPR